jgi:hypothetical protein
MILTWQALSDAARRGCNRIVFHGPEYWATHDPPLIEWLVIESSKKHAVFREPEDELPRGYIPRSVVEEMLGIDICDGQYTWFTREQGERMRAHPDWLSREAAIERWGEAP